MPTLADILTTTKTRAGVAANRAVDPDLAPNASNDALLTIYATAGAIKIANRSHRALARATIPIVASTFSYAVGNSIREVGALMLETGGASNVLALASGELVRKKAEDLDALSGLPTEGGFYADQVILYPIPDAVGTLRIYYWAASFVGETDAMDTDELPPGDLLNNFPAEFKEALEDWVLANWWLEIGETERARPLFQRFNETVDEGTTRPRRPRRILRSYKSNHF